MGRPPNTEKLPGDYLRNEQANDAWRGSSDRGAVLVLSAQLETLVDAAVRKSLTGRHRQGRHPLLDGPTAPVGTWFSKNLLLVESGIISKRLGRDIEWIRHIRNRFAQEWACDSLEEPKVHSQLLSLRSLLPTGVAVNEPHRGRSAFIAAVLSLMNAMDDICKQTRARPPKADEQVYRLVASTRTKGMSARSPARPPRSDLALAASLARRSPPRMNSRRGGRL
jgi:hypothetical protein